MGFVTENSGDLPRVAWFFVNYDRDTTNVLKSILEEIIWEDIKGENISLELVFEDLDLMDDALWRNAYW